MELRRRETGECFKLRDGMVFGRLDSCDVPLQDGSISRRHAQIEKDGNGWKLVDLGSSNGIFLNGARKEQFALRSGDLATLGALAFDVVAKQEEAPPPSVQDSPAAVAEPARAIDETAQARARLRREIAGDGRSRGLGDLGQQPLGIQMLVGLLSLALMYGIIVGIRYLGAAL